MAPVAPQDAKAPNGRAHVSPASFVRLTGVSWFLALRPVTCCRWPRPFGAVAVLNSFSSNKYEKNGRYSILVNSRCRLRISRLYCHLRDVLASCPESKNFRLQLTRVFTA